MPMTPVITKPNFRALVVAVGVFAFLYALSSFGLSALVNWFYPTPPDNLPQRMVASPLWIVLSFSLYIIPGFLAGFFAGRSGLMHGSIVGALTVPIMALILYVSGFGTTIQSEGLLYGLGLGLFWCSLSGLLGEFMASHVRKS